MASNDEQRSATTIITTAAQSIAARLIANETTAKFTKAEISTTNLFNQSVTELQVLTSLDNVQQTADINTVTVINNNTVNVNVAIDQTKAPNNYQMNSVGLFAVDGDGKEVLYSVTVLKDPVYIHQDAMGSALGIDLETVVGQASNVEISVNPAGAVTNEILKAALADYVKTDDVKSLIPATVIDGSKPADFKESVTLEKGAVDGAGNAIATSKDVSDGDATTLKSAKEYADTKVSGKADDSKVVHTTDTSNWQKQKVTADNGLPNIFVNAGSKISDSLKALNQAGFWSFYANSGASDNPWGEPIKGFTISNSTDGHWSSTVGALETSGNYVSIVNDNGVIRFNKGSDDSKVVHTADTSSWQKQKITNDDGGNKYSFTMANTTDLAAAIQALPLGYHTFYCQAGVKGNPSSQAVRGIAEITTAGNYPLGVGYLTDSTGDFWSFYVDSSGLKLKNKQDKLTITPADDSKVAHLSGANNFDTVPTVNNNPLLLASSLPSDLARLSQDANFTGKLQQNGQDVALANNTIARNPDTGVVSTPTDFTNLTVNGGKSVATRDDLKSLEASAWRELNFDVSQENYKAFSAAKIVYKINRDEKYISFFFVGTPSHVGNVANNSTLVTDTISLVMDLSSVLTEISGINFETEYGQISDNNSHAASLGYAGAKVVFTSQVFIPNDLVGVTFLPKDYPDCRIYYTSLVNGI